MSILLICRKKVILFKYIIILFYFKEFYKIIILNIINLNLYHINIVLYFKYIVVLVC